MNSQNKLYLHMGTPKTGSTSIQFFLAENTDILEKQGYVFPDMRNIFYGIDGYNKIDWEENAHCNGNILLDAYATSVLKRSKKDFEEFLDHLFPDLREVYEEKIPSNTQDLDDVIKYLTDLLEKSNVILSSENLWTISYDYLKILAAGIGKDRICPVIYLRRQDYYAESLWNEVVKVSVETRSVEDYYDYLRNDPADSHGIKYLRRLDELASILDPSTFIIRAYEKERFAPGKSSLSHDFLEAIGVDFDGFEWNKPKKIVNGHLDGNSVELKRIFNEFIIPKAKEEGKLPSKSSLAQKYDDCFLKGSLNGKSSNGHENEYYFEPYFRKNILDQVKEENFKVASKYLKGEDDLFMDKEYDRASTLKRMSKDEESRMRIILSMLAK